MKVKVCGITSYRDAALALDLGVDALGFNFYPPSPRYLGPVEAREIIQRLPAFAIAVGLFVNVPRHRDVEKIASLAGVHMLQLHGDETPEYCRRLDSRPLIKALRLGEKPLPAGLERFPVRAFLLDARDEELFGGTGKTFDWSLAAGIQQVRPIILAGGLRAGNVGPAIRAVRPYGVDVCSGVESSPGKKHKRKLSAFMDEVRNVSKIL